MVAASTVVEVAAGSVARTISRSTKVYLEYELPREGFAVKCKVNEGTIAVCGSKFLQRPDCSYAPTYDWKLEINDYSDLFINSDGTPNCEQQSASDCQDAETVTSNIVTIFVTIEGLDVQNTFQLNTAVGNAATAKGNWY